MTKLFPIFRRDHSSSEDLSASLDGELSPARSRAVEAHVASCEACQGSLGALRDVRTALSGLGHEAAPRSFRLREGWVPEQAPGVAQRMMRAAPLLAGLASLFVVGGLAWLYASGGGGGSGDSGGTLASAPARSSEMAADAAPPKSVEDYATTPGSAAAPAPNDSAGTADSPPTIAAAARASEPSGDASAQTGDAQTIREATRAAGDAGLANNFRDEDDGNDGNNAVIWLVLLGGGAIIVIGGAWMVTRRRGTS